MASCPLAQSSGKYEMVCVFFHGTSISTVYTEANLSQVKQKVIDYSGDRASICISRKSSLCMIFVSLHLCRKLKASVLQGCIPSYMGNEITRTNRAGCQPPPRKMTMPTLLFQGRSA